MTRPDDALIPPEELLVVRKHADLLLRDAGAYGVFPTPIRNIMAAAKVTIVNDEVLDESMLRRIADRLSSTVSTGIATVKSAFSKILGLFDARDRVVFLDKHLPPPRVPFVSLHEAGHSRLPHQSEMYALMHDCDQTLDDEIKDLFEREANVFASEVLFQGDVFSEVANSLQFGLASAQALAKQFGASHYSTFRRFVSVHHLACCLVVVNTEAIPGSPAGTRSVRRVIASRSFAERYDAAAIGSSIGFGHPLKKLLPFGKQRVVSQKAIQLVDRNGVTVEFVGESFTPKQILILIREAVGPKS